MRAFFAALPVAHDLRIYDEAGHAFMDDHRPWYVACAAADALESDHQFSAGPAKGAPIVTVTALTAAAFALGALLGAALVWLLSRSEVAGLRATLAESQRAQEKAVEALIERAQERTSRSDGAPRRANASANSWRR